MALSQAHSSMNFPISRYPTATEQHRCKDFHRSRRIPGPPPSQYPAPTCT